MAYAESLPAPVLAACRHFNTSCLLVSLLVCLDVFVLPRQVKNERILGFEEVYYDYNTQQGSSTLMDNILLHTDHHTYAYHKVQEFNPRRADSVQLHITPLFRLIETGYIRQDGTQHELKAGSSFFGTLAFIPIVFGLISVAGVALRRNKVQLLNTAVMNALLLFLLLLAEWRGLI